MKIEWLGHACFLIETKNGVKIITDPYKPGSFQGAVGYSDIDVNADIVTVSHRHFDHDYTQAVPSAQVVDKVGRFEVRGIEIEGIGSFHDEEEGAKRGENIIFILNAEGMRIGHLGDLGHIPLNLEKIKNLDVLLIPVGGTFTIDADQATQLIELIKPRIVIPMHFKTEKLGFDIDGVDTFIKDKPNVEIPISTFIEIDKDTVARETKIIVLKYAR